jgi:hypothetical protein
MQNGIAYPVPQLVGYTEEIAYGSSPTRWPTPDAHSDRGASSKERMQMKLKKSLPISINDQVAHQEMIQEHKKEKRKMWSTPTAFDANTIKNPRKPHPGGGQKPPLQQQVQMFPTPCARDWKGASSVQTIVDKMSKGLRAHMGQLPNRVALEESLNLLSQEDNLSDTPTMPKPNGQLNPTWVEWLMGYPEGWTDCED